MLPPVCNVATCKLCTPVNNAPTAINALPVIKENSNISKYFSKK